MTRTFRIAVIVALLAAAACREEGPGGDRGAGAPPPDGAPAGSLTRGNAAITVEGDVAALLSLRLDPSSTIAPPPGSMVLAWTGPQGAALRIEGKTFTGSRTTRPGFAVTLDVPEPAGGVRSYTSVDGGCTVTVDRLGTTLVAGRIACDGLGTPDATISASGTFSATA